MVSSGELLSPSPKESPLHLSGASQVYTDYFASADLRDSTLGFSAWNGG